MQYGAIVQFLDKFKYLLIAIVMLPVALVMVVFVAIVPHVSPTTVSSYSAIVSQVNRGIRWQDVLIFDYFLHQNDYTHVSPSDIRATAKRFIWKQTLPNPKYDKTKPESPTNPKYIHRITIRSLLDVMRRAGYTQADYEQALQLEQIVNDMLTSSVPYHVAVSQLRYQAISPELLYAYVHARNSIFTFQDVTTIVNAARVANINPALLIAITGQEESFVPATWPHAAEIRNNPFNVYYSWQDYNTSLSDAARIAAETVAAKLATPPPPGTDPIAWINDPNNPDGIYAQDPHWAYGVDDIFGSILQSIGKTLPPS